MFNEFDLRLFDAEGAEGAGAEGAGAESAGTESAGTEGAGTEGAEQVRLAEYQAMIEKYADLHEHSLQEAVKQQKAAHDALAQRYAALEQAVSPLYQERGITAGDTDALAEAIRADDSFWERGAEQAGMTVEQYKEMQLAIAENNQLRRSMEQQQAEDAANRQIAAWQQEAEQVKGIYPDFDLMQEIKNPLFASLIASKNEATRLSLQAAYEACHVQELTHRAAQSAAHTATQNTVKNIRAGAHRPKEGGSGSDGAITPGKVDIAKLTRAQRRELEHRAERGERITFQEGTKL